jgi:hypothetical protein
VQQIRSLQELIGLNLEEIRSVVTIEDHLEVIRAAYRQSESPEERRRLLVEALDATERLHARVAAKAERMDAFRDELAARLVRVRTLLAEDGAETVVVPG